MAAQLGPETRDLILPRIGGETELWRIMSWSTVELPRQAPDGPLHFRVRLLCSWDDERGLEAEYRDSETVYFGRARHP